MAEADAEDRRLADQFADLRGLVLERLGIAGAVREKHAVGLERQHVFGGGARRDNRHAAAGVDQAAQDVALDAEIVGDHVIAGSAAAPIVSEGEQGSTRAVHS